MPYNDNAVKVVGGEGNKYYLFIYLYLYICVDELQRALAESIKLASTTTTTTTTPGTNNTGIKCIRTHSH